MKKTLFLLVFLLAVLLVPAQAETDADADGVLIRHSLEMAQIIGEAAGHSEYMSAAWYAGEAPDAEAQALFDALTALASAAPERAWIVTGTLQIEPLPGKEYRLSEIAAARMRNELVSASGMTEVWNRVAGNLAFNTAFASAEGLEQNTGVVLRYPGDLCVYTSFYPDTDGSLLVEGSPALFTEAALAALEDGTLTECLAPDYPYPPCDYAVRALDADALAAIRAAQEPKRARGDANKDKPQARRADVFFADALDMLREVKDLSEDTAQQRAKGWDDDTIARVQDAFAVDFAHPESAVIYYERIRFDPDWCLSPKLTPCACVQAFTRMSHLIDWLVGSAANMELHRRAAAIGSYAAFPADCDAACVIFFYKDGVCAAVDFIRQPDGAALAYAGICRPDGLSRWLLQHGSLEFFVQMGKQFVSDFFSAEFERFMDSDLEALLP